MFSIKNLLCFENKKKYYIVEKCGYYCSHNALIIRLMFRFIFIEKYIKHEILGNDLQDKFDILFYIRLDFRLMLQAYGILWDIHNNYERYSDFDWSCALKRSLEKKK